ncbi:MAG: hypothetical protein Q8941_09015 [Bacteroidota bacterium]|nr:hypothetical protein [Bacteroidota bacterium]
MKKRNYPVIVLTISGIGLEMVKIFRTVVVFCPTKNAGYHFF